MISYLLYIMEEKKKAAEVLLQEPRGGNFGLLLYFEGAWLRG